MVNERGDSYSFIRDKAGQVCTERGFDGMTRHYTRNRAGETVRVERPGGSTAYEYDARGRVSTVSYHDGTREEYSYDKNGNLVMAANASARIRLERDAAGRIIRESMELPGGDKPVEVTSVESEYDTYGNRTRVRSSLGADVRLDYDGFGLVSGVNAHGGKEDAPAWESRIGRDDAGREVERFATGGIRIATDYDDMGMVRSRHVHSDGRHTGFPKLPLGRGRKAHVDALQSVCRTGHLRLRLGGKPHTGRIRHVRPHLPYARPGGEHLPGREPQGPYLRQGRTAAERRGVPLQLRL